jgi:hypothetical protein
LRCSKIFVDVDDDFSGGLVLLRCVSLADGAQREMPGARRGDTLPTSTSFAASRRIS